MIKSQLQTAAIYYFSGTGNAEKISHWISGSFTGNKMKTTVQKITDLDRSIPVNTNVDIIGFCSPTHGFNMPPVMLKFLFRFPKGEGQKVFVVNTRAGMKMGKLFLFG